MRQSSAVRFRQQEMVASYLAASVQSAQADKPPLSPLRSALNVVTQRKRKRGKLWEYIAWLKQQIAQYPVEGPNRKLSITCGIHRYPFTPLKEAISRSPLP